MKKVFWRGELSNSDSIFFSPKGKLAAVQAWKRRKSPSLISLYRNRGVRKSYSTTFINQAFDIVVWMLFRSRCNSKPLCQSFNEWRLLLIGKARLPVDIFPIKRTSFQFESYYMIHFSHKPIQSSLQWRKLVHIHWVIPSGSDVYLREAVPWPTWPGGATIQSWSMTPLRHRPSMKELLKQKMLSMIWLLPTWIDTIMGSPWPVGPPMTLKSPQLMPPSK